MEKIAIKYLRFSSEGQSNSSIEWQDTNTDNWCKANNVKVQDVFIDAGHSARTFDRPDWDKLYKFIEKNYRQVHYLVVSQLNRFSRDAGEAISMVKRLQMKFSIQIVSVSEGLIYDYFTPGSHFRSGLQLLLAEDDNITRMTSINSGIYTAKAVEGRYIGPYAPFGYRKEGSGKKKHLVIVEEEANVVRDIFRMFKKGTPVHAIYGVVKHRGFNKKGNSVIQKVLQNPIYSGQQYVKPFKNEPGGLYLAKHEAIIDLNTWNQVQAMFRSPRVNFIIQEDLPLRGVLHCHCGRLLTGANSRGKMGKLYAYYKCNTSSSHNNISAKYAENQLIEVMHWLSLSPSIISLMEEECEKESQERLRDAEALIEKAKTELKAVEQKIISMEDKWINNQMHFETYNRWFSDLHQRKNSLKEQIYSLSYINTTWYNQFKAEISALTDLGALYSGVSVTGKQELVRVVFDNSLYYQDRVYRTPYLIEYLSHNKLILKQKRLLFIDEKRDFFAKVPSGGATGNGIEPLIELLRVVRAIRA